MWPSQQCLVMSTQSTANLSVPNFIRLGACLLILEAPYALQQDLIRGDLALPTFCSPLSVHFSQPRIESTFDIAEALFSTRVGKFLMVDAAQTMTDKIRCSFLAGSTACIAPTTLVARRHVGILRHSLVIEGSGPSVAPNYCSAQTATAESHLRTWSRGLHVHFGASSLPGLHNFAYEDLNTTFPLQSTRHVLLGTRAGIHCLRAGCLFEGQLTEAECMPYTCIHEEDPAKGPYDHECGVTTVDPILCKQSHDIHTFVGIQPITVCGA